MEDNKQEDDHIIDAIVNEDLPSKIRDDVFGRLSEIAGHRPVVALLGKTGAGKSSLGNALFGKEVFGVSSVYAGTRAPTPISAAIFGSDITLIDFPGVGETPDRDEEYRALYRKWIAAIDVALWVVKMDDRVLAPDLEYFERVIKPAGFPIERIVFVISQVDKADPWKEWDSVLRGPGAKQAINIKDKISQLEEAFGVASSQVVPVSAEEHYNLAFLAQKIVSACPPKAALNVARALEGDLKTEAVRKTVLGKVWAAISGFYSENSEQINEVVIGIVLSLLNKSPKITKG